MNKEKVFAWIESLEDMADQSDRYFVERTELYKENQAKDKEIQRLNNIITKLELYLINERINNWKVDEWTIMKIQNELEKLKEGK